MLSVYNGEPGCTNRNGALQKNQQYVQTNFSSSRLQVVEEVELLMANPTLYRYTDIWRNPHWFDSISSLEATSEICNINNRNCTTKCNLSVRQLEGVKLIQSSLMYYVFDGTSLEECTNSRQDNVSAVSTAAIYDICSRLLSACSHSPSTRSGLQAVLETKQFSAFLSPHHVYLLKSPRSLRSLLWQRGIKFASVFGHSSDERSSINLSKEDLKSLTDSRANFPGCVRWKSLIDTGDLSTPTRWCLDRLKDVLYFEGIDEVKEFLLLLLEAVSSKGEQNQNYVPSLPSTIASTSKPVSLSGNFHSILPLPQKLGSDSGNDALSYSTHISKVVTIPEVFDLSCTKRILTNFAFRGGQLETSKLLWSRVDGDGWSSVGLKCTLTPAAQNDIIQGLAQLSGSSVSKACFKITRSSLDIWQTLLAGQCGNLTIPQDIGNKCPEILQWLENRIPKSTVELGKQQQRMGPLSFEDRPLFLTLGKPKKDDPLTTKGFELKAINTQKLQHQQEEIPKEKEAITTLSLFVSNEQQQVKTERFSLLDTDTCLSTPRLMTQSPLSGNHENSDFDISSEKCSLHKTSLKNDIVNSTQSLLDNQKNSDPTRAEQTIDNFASEECLPDRISTNSKRYDQQQNHACNEDNNCLVNSNGALLSSLSQTSSSGTALRRKVGPAPTLQKKRRTSAFSSSSESQSTNRFINNNNPVTPASASDFPQESDPLAVQKNVFNKLSETQRRSIALLGNQIVVFVGPFPFSPLTPSIPLDEVVNNSIFLQIFNCVDYIVISSSLSLSSIQKLLSLCSCDRKLRSFYWFTYCSTHDNILPIQSYNSSNEEEHEETKKNILSSSLMPLPISSPLLRLVSPWHNSLLLPNNNNALETPIDIPKPSSSRSVFFLVPDAITADLVSPLSADLESRVILDASARSLYNWLRQMTIKQSQWEDAALRYLSKSRRHDSHSNDEEDIKRRQAILNKMPSFHVHVLVILPSRLTLNDHYCDDNNDDKNIKENKSLKENCNLQYQQTTFLKQIDQDSEIRSVTAFETFTHEIVTCSSWPQIKKNIANLTTFIEQFPYSTPSLQEKNNNNVSQGTLSSRLKVWMLPLNYLEKCYRLGRLIEGSEILKHAVIYDEHTNGFRPLPLHRHYNKTNDKLPCQFVENISIPPSSSSLTLVPIKTSSNSDRTIITTATVVVPSVSSDSTIHHYASHNNNHNSNFSQDIPDECLQKENINNNNNTLVSLPSPPQSSLLLLSSQDDTTTTITTDCMKPNNEQQSQPGQCITMFLKENNNNNKKNIGKDYNENSSAYKKIQNNKSVTDTSFTTSGYAIASIPMDDSVIIHNYTKEHSQNTNECIINDVQQQNDNNSAMIINNKLKTTRVATKEITTKTSRTERLNQHTNNSVVTTLRKRQRQDDYNDENNTEGEILLLNAEKNENVEELITSPISNKTIIVHRSQRRISSRSTTTSSTESNVVVIASSESTTESKTLLPSPSINNELEELDDQNTVFSPMDEIDDDDYTSTTANYKAAESDYATTLLSSLKETSSRNKKSRICQDIDYVCY